MYQQPRREVHCNKRYSNHALSDIKLILHIQIKLIVNNRENTTMAFQPGRSGNIKGRPKGSLNKQTRLLSILETRAECLVNKLIDLALDGDVNALRLCIERLIPKVQRLTTDIEFPTCGNQESIFKLKDTVLRAALDGQISVDDAEKLTKLINNQNGSTLSQIPLNITTNDPIEASRIYQQIMTRT
jgi:hypothetical protein